MLDLAANPPVARRFGLGEDELERMAQLVAGSGVRWGLDAQHRRRFGLDSFGQNTWAAGLDRILLGVAMDSEGDRFIKTALPLDDVDSGDVELVGRIAELLSRLTSFCRRVGGFGAAPERHSLDWWLATCREALDSLTSVPRSESWQNAHAYGELARLAEEGGAGKADDEPVGETGRRRRDRAAVAGRSARTARGRIPRPGDPRQLPDRNAHDVHDAADAIRAAPGDLPARR